MIRLKRNATCRTYEVPAEDGRRSRPTPTTHDVQVKDGGRKRPTPTMHDVRAKDGGRSRLLLLLFAAGGAVATMGSSERVAYALQGGEDPALLPVLVDKRFGSDGRHQLGLFFSTSMVTKFVQATGAYATYCYSFSDVLGLELGGGYFFGSESNIMAEVRQNFPGTEPPLSDLYQLTWMGNLDLMLVPIYGKMSFASEVDPSFDLFLLAGGGFAGVRRKEGSPDNPPEGFDRKTTPAFNVGLGLRFYFNRLIAMRLELRDYFYPEPAVNASGMTYNFHFQGGLQFAFGGDE